MANKISDLKNDELQRTVVMAAAVMASGAVSTFMPENAGGQHVGQFGLAVDAILTILRETHPDAFKEGAA